MAGSGPAYHRAGLRAARFFRHAGFACSGFRRDGPNVGAGRPENRRRRRRTGRPHRGAPVRYKAIASWPGDAGAGAATGGAGDYVAAVRRPTAVRRRYHVARSSRFTIEACRILSAHARTGTNFTRLPDVSMRSLLARW